MIKNLKNTLTDSFSITTRTDWIELYVECLDSVFYEEDIANHFNWNVQNNGDIIFYALNISPSPTLTDFPFERSFIFDINGNIL